MIHEKTQQQVGQHPRPGSAGTERVGDWFCWDSSYPSGRTRPPELGACPPDPQEGLKLCCLSSELQVKVWNEEGK